MADDYTPVIEAHVSRVIKRTSLLIGKKYTGKVRDTYESRNYLLLVTTDRLSAFDRLLACVPFKGEVLNQTSAWWFNKTAHIVPNHVVSVPHPNVTIGKKCKPFPIEFVVRAYLTGTTSTSIWMHYKNGSREYCGHQLPDGMTKNQALPYVMTTPTTKDDVHDRPISAEDIVKEGWMTASDWEYTRSKALALFAFGQATAAERGLILVDTKYEFGKDADGVIHLIDEIHTPDSSRYWVASTYAERVAAGAEPDNIDKEFLRIWFRDHCDPYHDVTLPEAPRSLVVELSRRYIMLYEKLTGERFKFPSDATVDITAAIAPYFKPAIRRVVVVSSRGEHDMSAVAKFNSIVLGDLPSVGGVDVTPVAVEHYVVSAAESPLSLVTLCRDVTTDKIPTVFISMAVEHLDDVSAVLAAQTKYPVITVLGDGTTDRLSIHAQSSLLNGAGRAYAATIDIGAAAALVQRMLASM